MAILKALKIAVFPHSHSWSSASRNALEKATKNLNHKPLSTLYSERKTFQFYIYINHQLSVK